jgi:hypothetical protein
MIRAGYVPNKTSRPTTVGSKPAARPMHPMKGKYKRAMKRAARRTNRMGA